MASKYRREDTVLSYVMIAPSTIGLLIFVIYPLVWVFRLCVFSWDGMTKETFVGLYNFIRAFTRDPDYWQSVVNTFVLAIGKLSIELPLALVLAYILNKRLKFGNFFRAVFFLPAIVSVAIIGVVFWFLFASYDGIINGLLSKAGMIKEPINWFATKWHAMLVLGIASIWQNFGLNMVMFLMGLQSIPPELYESADIDGASEPRKFFSITIPTLGPVLQVIVMIALLGSLKLTDLVLVLTGGRPAGKSEVMMTFIYKFFFDSNTSSSPDFGYGSALAVCTSVILAIVTAFYLKFTNSSNAIR
jgi:raffinose/stachyose/melibiose transport system permease protein